MSTQTIRQRNTMRTARSQQRSAVNDWRVTPKPRAVPPAPAPHLSWVDRIAAFSWRLHDGMPWVWAAAGAVVLIASGAAVVGIAASLFGWRP